MKALKEIFEGMKTTPKPEQHFDKELDIKGRVLGTGPERYYYIFAPLFFLINITLLTIFFGSAFREFFLHSPLLNLLGKVSALLTLIIAQVATFLFWLITGIKTPMHYIYSHFPFGSKNFQSFCSLMPFSLTVLIILLRSYKEIYVSRKIAITLLIINIIIALLLGYYAIELLNGRIR